MTMRIINNKKVDLTDAEFKMYNEICQSYNTPRFKGEDLFKDLFESDPKTGLILFLRPPNKTHSSLEVFLFLITIMIQQNLRISNNLVDELVVDLNKEKEEIKTLKQELIELKNQLKK